MTSVFDLNAGEYSFYSLAPIEAVVAAYAQREKRDFNTWDYSRYRSLVTVADSSKSGFSVVTCGNQTCLFAKDRGVSK